MKETTKIKRINYYKSLIADKKLLLQAYEKGEYKRKDPDWPHLANKMITNWEYKIKQIQSLPTFTPHFKYITDPEYRKKYTKKSVKYPPIQEKICKMCLTIKKAEEFSLNPQVKTGLGSYCKSCYKKKYGWHTKDKDKYYEKYGKFSTREEMLEHKQKINSREYKRQRQDKFNKSWGAGVYLATSTGGTYIGYSVQLRARKIYHNSKSKRPDSPIAGIYKLLDFKILEITDDKSREQYWIKKLKPTLNRRKGGAGR